MSEFDKVLGKNIRVHRKKRNMHKSDVADRLGISVYKMNTYESGASPVTAELLFDLTHALGCSLADLLKGCKI